jgi:4'-phosphopantetheinyl transferase
MTVHPIDLWCLHLAATEELIARLYVTCSTDEQQRANRFRFSTDRRQFVLCRGVLRALVGWYGQISPEKVRFGYGAQGKPKLLNSVRTPLFFNVSHCGDRALFAFTNICELGADLERVRTLPDHERIAMHFFSEREHAMLRTVDPMRRSEAFFNCWTRKEAYIKATGEGLSARLDKFAVSLVPGDPPALLEFDDSRFDPLDWRLFHLTWKPSYVVAVAIPFRDCVLAPRQFEDAAQLLRSLATTPLGGGSTEVLPSFPLWLLDFREG